MRDTPGPSAGRRRIEPGEIERLVHVGIREAPGQRREGKIARHQYYRIGKGGDDEAMQQREVGYVPHPTRSRPNQDCDCSRAQAEHNAGPGGGRRTQPCPPCSAGVPAEHQFRQMAQGLAAKHVAGLDGQRVERPEIGLRDSKQRPPPEPSECHDRNQHRRRAGPRQFQNVVGYGREPGRRHQRRETKQHRRQQQLNAPGKQQFRQADLDQQTAGDRQHRSLPGAGGIVLDIALARIDQQAAVSGC